MPSLATRRRSFIWRDPQTFGHVSRHEIKGADLALEEVDQIIHYLRNFHRIKNIDIGGGVLFYGPNRIGKSYFASYLVSASGIRALNGWKFPLPADRELGELDAKDTHALYDLSREYVKRKKQPIIIYFDEFAENASDEMIDQLRIEIDGMEGHAKGIILVVTAVGDNIEGLDQGLFGDRRISIHIPLTYPNPHGSEEVLRFYIEKFPHAPEIDVKSIARILGGKKTPAALAELVHDSYRDADLEKDGGDVAVLEQRNLIKRCLREVLGFESGSVLSPEEQWRVACHEAAHAILARRFGLQVRLVSVLPTAGAELDKPGVTMVHIPDDAVVTIEMMKSQLVYCFGGMLAERLFGFKKSIGISDDMEKATGIAKELVEQHMCGRRTRRLYGPMTFSDEEGTYSEAVRRSLARDAAELLQEGESRARSLMRQIGKKKIERVAKALMEKGTLLQDDLDRLLK